MKLKRILAFTMAITLVAMCGCKENPTSDVSSTSEKTVYESRTEYTSSDAEIDKQKKATVDLSKTITNSEHCDMEYTITIPNWEYESDYVLTKTKNANYTRIYKSADENLKFFITEYNGNKKYIADKNKSFGSNTYAETLGLLAFPIRVTQYYLGEYSSYDITSKQPDYVDGKKEYYEFFLQYPYGGGSFKYAKGYVLVGVKRPIIVYFFDGTEGTIYDEEMMNKSFEIIKSINITEVEDPDPYNEFDENVIYD